VGATVDEALTDIDRRYPGLRFRVVDEALTDIDRRYPGLRFRVVDEQNRIRQHMRAFVDGERAGELTRRLTPTGEVHIFGALSGG
jgi:molybdopterin synthase sulfur carrier subunit